MDAQLPHNEYGQAECAWVTREFVNGRKQVEIADSIGVTSAYVCSIIVRFCKNCGHDVQFRVYGEERRDYARKALKSYQGELVRPLHYFDRIKWKPVTRIMADARHEHAWLLRAEGVTLHEIGERLGVSAERARQMIERHGRRMTRATRRVTIRTEAGCSND